MMSQVNVPNKYQDDMSFTCDKEEEQDKESPLSNQMMDTEGVEGFAMTLEESMDKTLPEEEVMFIPGSTFCLPLAHQVFTAEDLCTLDLPFIFWALIRLPLLTKPKNAMDVVFKAINEFFTKLQEADRKFTVFPRNLSKYGSLNSMPKVINDLDGIPTKVEDWLEYFPQAKPCFSRGDLYTLALLGCSVLLPKILTTLRNWFCETRYGLW